MGDVRQMKHAGPLALRRHVVLFVSLSLAILACARFDYELLSISAARDGEHCSNGERDQDETAIDCGGSQCAACGGAAECSTAADCVSLVCLDDACQAATCSDGVQNQGESAVDCGGGACEACPVGAACVAASDCATGECGVGLCRSMSCGDGVLSSDESAIDCGGAACAPCTDGSACVGNTDCASAICAGNVCQAPSCSDGVVNQGETDVDCGGTVCGGCGDGAACSGVSDCTSAVCVGNICQVANCSDSVQNQDETAVDCGGSSCVACGVNTAPLVQVVVSPGAGTFDGTPTVFLGDSTGTTDREDAADRLAYAWDWDNDGAIDGTGATSTHRYAAQGTFEARLTVQDTGGLTSTALFLVVVASEARVLHVTTAADEDDANATPASPGGTGLSLREAMTVADGATDKQVVVVPSGFVIHLGAELPALTDDAGVDIIGDGAVIDGSGTAQVDDCLQIDTAQTRVFGLEIENCSRSPLRVSFVTGCQFSRLQLHDNGQAAFINGPGNIFGPGNVIRRSAEHGLTVYGETIVVENEFHDNTGRGIDLTGSSDGSLVIGNVATGNDPGILFGAGANSNVVIHNTLHRNASDGVFIAGAGSTGIVLQNNIFSENAGFGLRASDTPFAGNDHNDYFSNTLGECSDCSTLGPGSSSSDPLYIDAAANDFRLGPASTNRDAGIDTGRDVNGPVPGNGLFNGSNPDIGARESP